MSEYREHKQLADYIKMQYPNVIFTSDSSGIRLTIGNAKKMLALKSNHKIPDMIILHPNKYYKGLILEIKRSDEKIYLKDGSLSQRKHILDQAKTLNYLTDLGYWAGFGVGFDACKEIVDRYMNL